MTRRFRDIAYTDSVKRAQARLGTREHNERAHARAREDVQLGPREIAFLAERDSFYMATVSDSGWPYVQHRGGAPGFLRVLGPTTLGFADFRGNLQYLSVGNIDHDERVSLILVDYAQRRRLKILGRARTVAAGDVDPRLRARIEQADYGAVVERLVLIEVEGYDWNCSQHITPRYTQGELDERMQPLQARLALLETRLRDLGQPLP